MDHAYAYACVGPTARVRVGVGRLLLLGKGAACVYLGALLLGAKGNTHARRGIRSGSKLIEGLDMAQTPLESGGDSHHAKATCRVDVVLAVFKAADRDRDLDGHRLPRL